MGTMPGPLSAYTESKLKVVASSIATAGGVSTAKVSVAVAVGTAIVKITMAGSIAEYNKAKLDAIKKSIAQATGIHTADMTLTVAAGSVVVSAVMPFAAAATLTKKI